MIKDVYVPSYLGELGFNVPTHSCITRVRPTRAELARMGVFVVHPSILKHRLVDADCTRVSADVESDWFSTGCAEVRVVLSNSDCANSVDESLCYVTSMLKRLKILRDFRHGTY